MTQNKTQKIAIRRRMAETGESYVVARRAVLGAGEAPEVDQAAGTQMTGAAGAAQAGGLTPEEQYALEAAAAGVSAGQIDAQAVAYRLEAAAERAQEAAERARELADRAEQEAERTEDLAGRAEEAAEEAEEWAGPAERRLLRDRAEQLQQAVEQTRERAHQAEEAAVAAEERADRAADAAEEAANGEFPGEPDDDPGWVWAEATSGGDQAAGAARPWGRGDGPVPPVPPVPPRPPAPPVPPVPPVRRW